MRGGSGASQAGASRPTGTWTNDIIRIEAARSSLQDEKQRDAVDDRTLTAYVVIFGVFSALVVWDSLCMPYRPFAQIFLLPGPTMGWVVLACAPMLAGLALVLRSPWPPLVRLRRGMEAVGGLFSRATLVELALLSAVAGGGLELLFRGLIQTSLTSAVGVPGAVALTSVAFGAAHCFSWTSAAYATLCSVYLGVLVIGFGSLTVPALAHTVYLFGALVYLSSVRPAP